jgi:hypothetical protein
MKKLYYILAVVASFAFVACDDYLTIYPEDDIIDEKYWNTGDNVQSVVAACYRYMADNNVLRKMVLWGEMRSDNVDYSTGGSEEENLHDANVLSSSSLVRWNGFYKVINICNNVIQKAPAVRDKDANFTETKFHSYMAEAYTLRALCYFYLVRSFGDVPYVTEPSASEQQNYMVDQTPADSIVDFLISDLEQYGLQWAPEDWPTEEYTHGRITLNAVRALLADIYLWKASDINNSNAQDDYQRCADLCDAILNDNQSTLVFSEVDQMYNDIFYEGNAPENIFELNFVTNGLANTTTSVLFGNRNKGTTAHFRPTQNLYGLYSDYDVRRYQYMELSYVTSGSTMSVSSYKIFKYEGAHPASDFGSTDYTYRASSSYANWIIYRLADVYLMKAEALAELAKIQGSEQLAYQSLQLCNVIHRRATQDLDTLTISQVADAEDVVLEERRRELCFEGKRWYDLLRKVRREGNTEKAVELLVNARSGETSLFESRLSSIDAWYLPISQTEMQANPHLHQNAYYTLKEQ